MSIRRQYQLFIHNEVHTYLSSIHLIDRWIDGYADRWIDGQIDRQIGGQIDRQIGGQINR